MALKAINVSVDLGNRELFYRACDAEDLGFGCFNANTTAVDATSLAIYLQIAIARLLYEFIYGAVKILNKLDSE